MKIKSYEFLSFIVKSGYERIEIDYSSIYDMIEELRESLIFCDFSAMDFEDLMFSFPQNIKFTSPNITIKTDNLSIQQFDSSDFDSLPMIIQEKVNKAFENLLEKNNGNKKNLR